MCNLLHWPAAAAAEWPLPVYAAECVLYAAMHMALSCQFDLRAAKWLLAPLFTPVTVEARVAIDLDVTTAPHSILLHCTAAVYRMWLLCSQCRLQNGRALR